MNERAFNLDIFKSYSRPIGINGLMIPIEAHEARDTRVGKFYREQMTKYKIL